MKKNMRVIQINGFRGLLFAFFIISCLVAGFIAFPAFLTMQTWNYLALKTGSFPALSFTGGALLWAIIALSIYLFNKRRLIVSFGAQQELSEDEIKNVISKIRAVNDLNLPRRNENISKTETENNEQKAEITEK